MEQEKQITDILQRILLACRGIFQDNLTGVYVHGSLAFGCFRWESSDIDFLIVVKEAPSLREKMGWIESLLALEPFCPAKGLEMSVVLEKDCREFTYPPPFLLHFSKMHEEACRKNIEAFCLRMQGTDKDLAAHFAVTRKMGITLWGQEASSLFEPVPVEAFWDSIKNDILCLEREIKKQPVYLILNACRVMAFLEEGRILSKEQGAFWGMEHLPEIYTPLIERAQSTYRSGTRFEAETAVLKAFAGYVQKKLQMQKPLPNQL